MLMILLPRLQFSIVKFTRFCDFRQQIELTEKRLVQVAHIKRNVLTIINDLSHRCNNMTL